mmetsp:Transcript_24542/g.55540  ORF Transcript_24542/g.55540 Transcript_24542/m.55540 type:complete len:204 (+) Transcript_24542:652-1263(+)
MGSRTARFTPATRRLRSSQTASRGASSCWDLVSPPLLFGIARIASSGWPRSSCALEIASAALSTSTPRRNPSSNLRRSWPSPLGPPATPAARSTSRRPVSTHSGTSGMLSSTSRAKRASAIGVSCHWTRSQSSFWSPTKHLLRPRRLTAPGPESRTRRSVLNPWPRRDLVAKVLRTSRRQGLRHRHRRPRDWRCHGSTSCVTS